jgi:hypothetical protein
MRQVFSRLVVASGLLALACATAMEDGPLIGDQPVGTGGTTSTAGHGGSLPIAGSISNTSGASSAGTTSMPSGGKGGTGSTAFGGTSTSSAGSGGSSKGGSAAGGQGTSGSGGAAGSAAGGKGGTASGGSATAGTSSGGAAGTGNGTAGSMSTTCNGVADWTSKTYAIGDLVASTCNGVFAAGCPAGQSHKFECNPGAGVPALPWCMSREPGVGNGWGEAWVDKGQCPK